MICVDSSVWIDSLRGVQNEKTDRLRGYVRTVRRSTDCLIAAVCIRESVPLLHDDVDFQRIADVSELQVA